MAGNAHSGILDSWKTRRLDEVATIIDSLHKTPAYTEQGLPMVRVTDIKGGFLDLSGTLKVTEDVFAEFTRRHIPHKGDIVFSRVGTYGNASYVASDAPFCLGQNTALIHPSINSRFLHYCLQSPAVREQIEHSVVGSTQKTISLKSIGALQIPLPPDQELAAIAHILGTLDDKIELNRRMNETLEAIGRALFKSWFVDFDPVRAKAGLPSPSGRGAGGEGAVLPKPLADLFPDSFEDSELGEIPKGWKIATLSDFAALNPESWSKETRPSIISYVDLSNTKWGRIEEVTAYIQKEAPSRAQRVLRSQDTIVGTVRPGNGSYALVSQDGLTGSTAFAVLRPRRREYTEFVYLAATTPDNIDRLAHLADGAAYPAVRPETVTATAVVKAGDSIIKEFSQITRPLLGKIAANERESVTLAASRDTLLPKLISGKLRVRDMEQATEVA